MTSRYWQRFRKFNECGRKRLVFSHEGQARREAFTRGLRAYLCSYCDKWHLTSRGAGR